MTENDIAFEVVGNDWLGGIEDVDDATFASLVVRAGGLPLTEVHDSIAMSLRPSIRVSTARVAVWLATEWWRLRWEARPEPLTVAWRRVHSMAGLGGGYAWPPLEVASDGELVQLTIRGEPEADAAAIRYIRNVTVEVSASVWERAVDQFLDQIQGRLAAVLPGERDLAEVRAELNEERTDPQLSQRCRREAEAGLEPGDATDEWHTQMERLFATAGEVALGDLLAATGGGPKAVAAVERLQKATTKVDLAAATGLAAGDRVGRSWERGERAAARVRAALGVTSGPLTDAKLGEALGVKLPLTGDATQTVAVAGGYRPSDGSGTTAVALGISSPIRQRFALARLVGMAALLPREHQVLPMTPAKSAAQKFGRSFGRELLCPWAELDALTDEHGTGESAITMAADRYMVSELAIAATLVNKGKMDRARLPAFA